jgi:hypothetical protein
MDIDAVTVGNGFRLRKLAGTRQDERCRTMGASAGRAVHHVQTTGTHAEDVPKRGEGGRSGKATARESEFE